MNPRMIEIKLRTFLFEGNRTDWVGGA